MNEALNTKRGTRSANDLDLESLDDFEKTIRRECGLMLSIYENKVYFLHQTVREFLQSVGTPLEHPTLEVADHIPQVWRNSISQQTAHKVLGDCCLTYLSLVESQELEAKLLQIVEKHNHENVPCEPRDSFYSSLCLFLENRLESRFIEFIKKRRFYTYCCSNWDKHVLKSKCLDLQIDGRCQSLFRFGPKMRISLDDRERRAGNFWHSLVPTKMPGRHSQHRTLEYMMQLNLTQLVEKVVQEDKSCFEFREYFHGRSLLWIAIGHGVDQGDFEIAESLLRLGADPHDFFAQKLSTHEDDIPDYLLADLCGNFVRHPTPEMKKLILVFVEMGASLTSYPFDVECAKVKTNFDPAMKTPIFQALLYGGAESLSQFISMGADVRATHHFGSLLHLCQVNDKFGPGDWRYDHETPVMRQADICKLLIDHGVEVNIRDYKGRTPLFYANQDVIKLLLETGADIHAQDNEGLTPLHIPLDKWSVDICVSEGIQRGNDVNPQDVSGLTPLHYASCIEVERSVLVEKGLNPTERDNDGNTLLDTVSERLACLEDSRSDPIFTVTEDLEDMVKACIYMWFARRVGAEDLRAFKDELKGFIKGYEEGLEWALYPLRPVVYTPSPGTECQSSVDE
ncbi:Nucleoside phosphorylase domain protein [Apiospora sp. TS-2023a]